MPKKINTEELEELAQKLIAADLDSALARILSVLVIPVTWVTKSYA